MAHRLHQIDEFPLVDCELGVMRADGATEECDRAYALMQNRTEAQPRSVAVDGE
jgi:hypothetical protein